MTSMHDAGADFDDEWNQHLRWLFVRTMDRMGAIAAGPIDDPYVLFEAASLQRKLLHDATALAKEVNARGPQMKLVFSARPMHESQFSLNDVENEAENDSFITHGECLHPAVPCAESTEPLNLSLDGWHRHIVGYFNQKPFTVRDYISDLANRFGGVHIGAPESPRQVALFKAYRAYETSYQATMMRGMLMCSILRVTHDALYPLGRWSVDRLRADTIELREARMSDTTDHYGPLPS